MLSLIDQSASTLLLALSAEKIHPNEIKPVRKGWETLLAKARKRFLIDELTIKNGLSLEGLKGAVLEIDNASSELTQELRNQGYSAKKHQCILY